MKSYRRLSTQFYDLAKTESDAAPEVAFYTEYAQQVGGLILEPMCGSGRILLPLLHAGFAIEGFDASAAMLEALCKKHAKVSDQVAPVWQQYMQDFSNQKKYNLIIIPFGSFGLLTERIDAQRALETLYEHLSPEGMLIVEIDTVYSLDEQYGVPLRAELEDGDGGVIVLNTLFAYDACTQIFTSRSVYEHIDTQGVTVETEEEYFAQYVYYMNEVDQMFEQIGFCVEGKYKNYDRETACSSSSPRIVYVVRKRDDDV